MIISPSTKNYFVNHKTCLGILGLQLACWENSLFSISLATWREGIWKEQNAFLATIACCGTQRICYEKLYTLFQANLSEEQLKGKLLKCFTNNLNKCWEFSKTARIKKEKGLFNRYINVYFAEYQDAFQMFDKDDNGYIISRELKQLLRCLGCNPTDSELQQIINEADADGKQPLVAPEYYEAADFYACIHTFNFKLLFTGSCIVMHPWLNDYRL